MHNPQFSFSQKEHCSLFVRSMNKGWFNIVTFYNMVLIFSLYLLNQTGKEKRLSLQFRLKK